MHITNPETDMTRHPIFFALAATALTTGGTVQAQEVPQGAPNAGFAPEFAEQTRAPAMAQTAVTTETFAGGLENPWGIAPLSQGRWLVTERPGRMRIVAADGTVGPALLGLPDVAAEGQGGLLDVTTAEGPDGTEIYWTYAKAVDGGFVTAAARGVLTADETGLEEVREIFEQTPVSSVPMHFGSRIVVDGPHVFITTGEHFAVSERVKAQDLQTTFGKVVRLMRDGSIPDDNPFVAQGAPQVWTLGHRNMQGATLGPDGALWTIEHGPRGRRRAEPARARPELWLARSELWHQL